MFNTVKISKEKNLESLNFFSKVKKYHKENKVLNFLIFSFFLSQFIAPTLTYDKINSLHYNQQNAIIKINNEYKALEKELEKTETDDILSKKAYNDYQQIMSLNSPVSIEIQQKSQILLLNNPKIDKDTRTKIINYANKGVNNQAQLKRFDVCSVADIVCNIQISFGVANYLSHELRPQFKNK